MAYSFLWGEGKEGCLESKRKEMGGGGCKYKNITVKTKKKNPEVSCGTGVLQKRKSWQSTNLSKNRKGQPPTDGGARTCVRPWGCRRGKPERARKPRTRKVRMEKGRKTAIKRHERNAWGGNLNSLQKGRQEPSWLIAKRSGGPSLAVWGGPI